LVFSLTTKEAVKMNDTFIEKPLISVKRKLVFGVGINDADYTTQYKNDEGKSVSCPYYRRWASILTRCYSKNHQAKYPTYIGCCISLEWIKFSNFKAWMIKQEWRGLDLDKDLLYQDNKMYSAETCIFIPQWLNSLTIDGAAGRGEFPIGVYYRKDNGKYRATCKVNGKLKHLGYFGTPEEAAAAYKVFKENHVHEIARNLHTFEDVPAAIIPRLRPALLAWRVN